MKDYRPKQRPIGSVTNQGTKAKPRYSCAGTSLFGHKCARLVRKRGDLCPQHKAASLKPRVAAPDAPRRTISSRRGPSTGAVISGTGRP